MTRGNLSPTRLTYEENFSINVGFEDAKQCVNVRAHNNRLSGGCNWIKMGYSDVYGILGRTSSGLYLRGRRSLYLFADNRLEEIWQTENEIEKCCSVVFRNRLYASFNGEGLLLFNGRNVYKVYQDDFDDVVFAGDRFVGLRGNALIFGMESDCYDIRTEDYLQLKTPCNALIAVNNVAYALGNVCYKVEFSFDETKVKVTEIGGGYGCVLNGSARIAGKKAAFLTETCMYALSSDKISLFAAKTDLLGKDVKYAVASSYDGTYVLSIDRDGQYRSAYAFDLDAGDCVYALDEIVSQIYQDEFGAVCVDGTGDFYFEDKSSSGAAVFCRSNVDFGCSGKKFLRSLTIRTKSDVYVEFKTDEGSCGYNFTGGDSIQTVALNGCGREFSYIIKCYDRANVDLFKLTADVYKEADYVD